MTNVGYMRQHASLQVEALLALSADKSRQVMFHAVECRYNATKAKLTVMMATGSDGINKTLNW